ncbi:hypothetical protein [Subtercola frigoramans]|uniref:MFS family permease n=1 Tax=Subtercola frigoramans TaxID=120298 RepID=A0ABS2L1C8_9MICO|nr:hypothetical protein [Subtercola frigoramans]MBM7470751.1 MFS family permease [Subtercola frigoramans]
MLAGQVFHLDLHASALTSIVAFGLAKAGTNYFACTLSDRYGRNPILIAGWLVALLAPFTARSRVHRTGSRSIGDVRERDP